MTQSQGESKVKLHTMNLVAAVSRLTDMGLFEYSAKFHGIFINSVVHVGRGWDLRKIGGTLASAHQIKYCVKP